MFFAAGGQTNEFSQFGQFSIGLRRLLPHAKLSGTSLKVGTCGVNFSV